MNDILKNILRCIRVYVDLLIDLIFSFFLDCHKVAIPDLDKRHAFLSESATELGRRIKDKRLKSEDLVRAVIERIKLVNPVINAIADERYEAAISEAKEVDERVAAGLSEDEKNKPFLGVPFTTKECQPVKGMRLTLGLWSRRSERADEDSEAIKRLKEAGAIPLAASNLPELLIWQESRNYVYGQTNNPHHAGRTTGGSSGGEAALTASYATPISLCSDIGGSTRMPAFYCGMFGHHPTPNVTNCQGIFFRKGDEESMLSLGFISKHVEDLGPLVKIIAGEKAPQLKLDRKVDIKDIKFYFVDSADDCLVSSIRPELEEAMNEVVRKINREVPTEQAPQPYSHEAFGYMYKLWSYWMTKEPENFAHFYTNRKGVAIWYVEVIKKLFCLSYHCLSSVIHLVDLQLIPRMESTLAEKITKELKEDLFSKLGDNGVLLFPSAPHPAPYHYSCFLRPYNFAYWAMINVLKCPSTQVPLGKNNQGLPLGIQVVAAPYNDALCLTVAKYLEEHFGGAVMPCKIQN